MAPAAAHTLPKRERLSGKAAIARLLEKGRYGNAGCLRYCYLPENGFPYSRILVSVPKRSFKRAVRRNLLKRRIRESYRLRKELLVPGTDVMFIYTPKTVLPLSAILRDMETALPAIPASLRAPETPAE